MEKEYTFQPDYAVHPGEYLKDVIEARNLNKSEIAKALDIEYSLLMNIINCQKPIDPELSIRLEKVLGISHNIWNNMNTDYYNFYSKNK